MRFQLSSVFFTLSLIAGSHGAPAENSTPAGHVIGGAAVAAVKRDLVCNADNCLRALRATKRATEATAFCSSYIQLPAVSETAATVYPKTTITSDVIIEHTNVIYETRYTTITHSPVDTTTITETVTVPPSLVRRSDVPVPDFLTQYPAARLSSACSCFLPKPTTTVTPTAAVATFVESVSRTVTVDDAQTTVITTDYTLFETKVESTVTETSTVTVTAVPSTPASFYLKSDGGSYDKSYLVGFDVSGWDRSVTYTTTKSSATKFTLEQDGTLSYIDSNQQKVFTAFSDGYDQISVFFLTKDTMAICPQCYPRTFRIDGNVLISTTWEGLTVHMTCPHIYQWTPQTVWAVAKPGYQNSKCSPLKLVIEAAE